MQSTRRGFLAFLGGGAVAGPSALKNAVSKNMLTSKVASAVASTGFTGGIVKNPSRAAEASRWIRRLMTKPAKGAVFHTHDISDANVDSLKSVSNVYKRHMHERSVERYRLAEAVNDFIQNSGLDIVGMNERDVLNLIKKFSDD